jgi:pimeloyl-ACP methyl ester carboxylesterase
MKDIEEFRQYLSESDVEREDEISEETQGLITEETTGLTPEEEYYQIIANTVAYAEWNIGDILEDPTYEGAKYKVQDVIKNNKGLQIVVLAPLGKTDPPNPPIFACRGTLNMANVVDDLGKVIGKQGLMPSFSQIEQQLEELTEKYGSAVICGHSLGGAIAQILTAKYCDRLTAEGKPWVKKCIHFNAPGCGKKITKEYATKKRGLEDPPEIIAWHQGKDIVYKAGGPHLEADKELIVIKKWKKNVVKQILTAHSDLSLQRQRTYGQRLKVKNYQKGLSKEKRKGVAVGVEGVRDTVRHVTSTGIKKMITTPQEQAIVRADKLRAFIGGQPE